MVAIAVEATEGGLVITLDDGTKRTMPWSATEALRKATPEQRRRCRIVGRGVGIHWSELDEDLSIRGIARDFW